MKYIPDASALSKIHFLSTIIIMFYSNLQINEWIFFASRFSEFPEHTNKFSRGLERPEGTFLN